MRKRLRKIGSSLFANLLILSGSVRKVKKQAQEGSYILSIYFHAPGKKLFEQCIKWLLKNGFHFISIDELRAIANKEQPFPKGAVVITIDDGWISNKENIVSVADKYKVPVTIFLATEPVEKGTFWWSYIEKAIEKGWLDLSVDALKEVPNEERLRVVNKVKSNLALQREAMTVEQVRGISKDALISIGSHTVTHPILPACNSHSAYFEISESKRILESWLNKEVRDFAFPSGRFTHREIEMLKSTGYRMAFTTQTQYITPDNVHEIYALPRFQIYEKASFAENICRMMGVWFRHLPFKSKN